MPNGAALHNLWKERVLPLIVGGAALQRCDRLC
jgi:hypothetical protein